MKKIDREYNLKMMQSSELLHSFQNLILYKQDGGW